MPATDHLRLVDHHCHGVIDYQPDGEEFRILATATPLRQLLEIAPFNKVLYSSDAYGLPEHYLVSAANWRAALGSLLDEWIGGGWVSAGEAERIAGLMARGNAERSYDPRRAG